MIRIVVACSLFLFAAFMPSTADTKRALEPAPVAFDLVDIAEEAVRDAGIQGPVKIRTSKENGIVIMEVGRPQNTATDTFRFDVLTHHTGGDHPISVPHEVRVGVTRTDTANEKAAKIKRAIERSPWREKVIVQRMDYVLTIKAAAPHKGMLAVGLLKNWSKQTGMKRRVSTPPREAPSSYGLHQATPFYSQIARFWLSGTIPTEPGYVVQLGTDRHVVTVDPHDYASIPHLLFDLVTQLNARDIRTGLFHAAGGLTVGILIDEERDQRIHVSCNAPTLVSSDLIELF